MTGRWLDGHGLAAWLVLGLALSGCSLDFNEAVPCTNNDQCPPSFVCNLSVGRCEASQTPVDDVTSDTDSDVDGDLSGDTGPDDPVPDPDTGGDEADATEEPADDTGAEPDVAGDVCVPTAEVCNGEDDDCNDIPDDGIDCGTCPDADNMALIVRDGVTPFCIDLYEASRPDASLASPGSDESQAASQRAVIPWSDVPLANAAAACTAAGKRLCTATEWMEACGGPQGWLYPYNATTYEPNTCNGADTPDPDAVGPTASRINCVSPDGTLDMSGNLEEWVEGGTTRGGSYEDGTLTLRCTGAGETPDQATPGASVGFRCCATADGT